MKKISIISVLLALIIILTACKETKETKETKKVDPPIFYNYDAEHTSNNNLLMFKSSDSGLDSFLNDLFERHMRYNENRIHTHPVGGGSSAWKEWEAIIGSWWDSSASFNKTMPAYYATKDYVTNWLINPKQDNQGYIWCDPTISPTSWGMGWAFPNNKSIGIGYNFDSSTNDFTSPSNSALSVTDKILTGDSSMELTASGKNVSEITIESPAFQYGAFYIPFVKLGWQLNVEGDASNIDDLYIYFQTQDQSSYSEDKCVKYSDFCITGAPIVGDVPYNLACFPMYINELWGKSTKNNITKIKIALKAKNGTTISADIKYDFIWLESDDRQSNNLGNYIIAAENIIAYSQDKSLLTQILPKARAAMQHYLSVLDGSSGLASTAYYIGHESVGRYVAGSGIGNGFWDITAYPKINIYTNLSFYRAIKSMIYLEELAKTFNVSVSSTSIVGSDMNSLDTYTQTVDSLKELEKKVKKNFQEYFYDEDTGRFFAGCYDGSSIKQDNGYLMFNLEAVDAGLATDTQAKSIMAWINGDRKIDTDDSQGADIYKYEFAPRNTTKQNYSDYVWIYGGCQWATGVHNGGAVLQTTYYDLKARAKYLGADNAFTRLKAIQTWYEKVLAAGGKGQNFYRKYYSQIGIALQGGPTGGPVGLDYEFLEAALMFSAIPEAFFGMSVRSDKTLTVSPVMPAALNYWQLENLLFSTYYYDLSVGKYFVEISNVHNKADSLHLDGYSINVEFDKPYFNFKVFYEGQETNYTEKDGKIIVNIPFMNGKVEIKEG